MNKLRSFNSKFPSLIPILLFLQLVYWSSVGLGLSLNARLIVLIVVSILGAILGFLRIILFTSVEEE